MLLECFLSCLCHSLSDIHRLIESMIEMGFILSVPLFISPGSSVTAIDGVGIKINEKLVAPAKVRLLHNHNKITFLAGICLHSKP